MRAEAPWQGKKRRKRPKALKERDSRSDGGAAPTDGMPREEPSWRRKRKKEEDDR
jgi:hypothetical protein